jgi:hypothetical protein
MSTSDFQGKLHAFKVLMQLAQQDIDQGGEIKPAKPCTDPPKRRSA